MATPVCTSTAVTCTLVWGGEYRVALSRSSAAAWMTGSTWMPLTAILAMECSSMRRYSRIRDMAPRSTLYSGTGLGHWRPGRPPPSTAMESARRPISAVPWSMRSRSSKTSGLRPWSSSISRSSTFCWWTIAWTRRAMLTKERCAASRCSSSWSTIRTSSTSNARWDLGMFRWAGSLSTSTRTASSGEEPARTCPSTAGSSSSRRWSISASCRETRRSMTLVRCASSARAARTARPRRTTSAAVAVTSTVAMAPHQPTAVRAGPVIRATAAPVAAAIAMAGSNNARA